MTTFFLGLAKALGHETEIFHETLEICAVASQNHGKWRKICSYKSGVRHGVTGGRSLSKRLVYKWGASRVC